LIAHTDQENELILRNGTLSLTEVGKKKWADKRTPITLVRQIFDAFVIGVVVVFVWGLVWGVLFER